MEQMQDVRQVSETKRLLLLLLPLPPAPLHRGARLSPLGAPAGLPVTARARRRVSAPPAPCGSVPCTALLHRTRSPAFSRIFVAHHMRRMPHSP
jgi:hypothetical protein